MTHGEAARIFNEGCDARLAGVIASHCPYPNHDERAKMWQRGWLDVDQYWGQWGNKLGWPIKPLPKYDVSLPPILQPRSNGHLLEAV